MGADEIGRPPKLSNFRRSAAGKALLDGTDAAAPEDPPEAGGVASPVKISIRVENGPRPPREGGEAVELEMAVDDVAVGHPSSEGVPDVPQGGRPDLPVVVLVGVRPVIEAFVGEGAVELPDAGGGAVAARRSTT